MAKLTRVTGKVFGSQASPTGDVDNGAYIGQFGSAQAGTYVGTDDVAMIQNLPAWEQGWIGACVEEDQLPPLPERTGVDKVLSYQECYLLQQGMPEWDSATTFYVDNFCSYNGVIYKSLTDINLNNQPDTSVANWEVYGKISQYTKFAINKGNENLLVNNSNELAFDVDNNNPLTYTNIMGETRTVNALSPIDVSTVNDGTYKVALPQSGNQPYLTDDEVFITEDETAIMRNIANGTNAIGATPYAGTLAGAFDGSLSTSVSFYNNGSSISGVSYIGQSNLTTQIKKIRLYQGSSSVNNNVGVTSIKIQISTDGISWTDIQTVNNLNNGSVQGQYYLTEIDVNDYTLPPNAYSMRILANSGVIAGNNNAWKIGEIEFISNVFFVGDIWINPQELYTVQQYDGTNWQDFNDVVLLDSSVTVSSGVITDLKQPKYNNPHITPNKSYISGLGMPSNKYIDLTLGASGSTYVALANGYFYLSKNTGSTNQNIALANITKNFLQDSQAYSSGIALNATCVAEKGDIINIGYSATGTTNAFRFIYANGEV